MTTTKHTATLLILMFVGLMGLAHAQLDTKIKAQVPFNFVANGKTMPAGECTIRIKVNGGTTLSISSGKQHAFAFPIADGPSDGIKGRLLCFTDTEIGTFLPVSRTEEELAISCRLAN